MGALGRTRMHLQPRAELKLLRPFSHGLNPTRLRAWTVRVHGARVWKHVSSEQWIGPVAIIRRTHLESSTVIKQACELEEDDGFNVEIRQHFGYRACQAVWQ